MSLWSTKVLVWSSPSNDTSCVSFSLPLLSPVKNQNLFFYCQADLHRDTTPYTANERKSSPHLNFQQQNRCTAVAGIKL